MTKIITQGHEGEVVTIVESRHVDISDTAPVVDSEFIEEVEALARQHKMYVEIEGVAPAHVPSDYEEVTPHGSTKQAVKLFPNGSTIHLDLLLF